MSSVLDLAVAVQSPLRLLSQEGATPTPAAPPLPALPTLPRDLLYACRGLVNLFQDGGPQGCGTWAGGSLGEDGPALAHLCTSVQVQSRGAQAKRRRSSGRCWDALIHDGHGPSAAPVQKKQFLHHGMWLPGPGGAEVCEETASPPQEPVHGHARGSLSDSACAPQISAQP